MSAQRESQTKKGFCMKSTPQGQSTRSQHPPEVFAYSILLAVPVLLTLWVYFGKRTNFVQFFPAFQNHSHLDVYSALYEYLAAFILMFLVPFVILRLKWKFPLNKLGLQTGDWRVGVKLLAFGIPIGLLIAYLGARSVVLQAEYPYARSALPVPWLFLAVEAGYLVYYFAWEFLFRGVMLFGLEKYYGVATAILIQTIPSALVHIGKPFSESFAAILAGLVFGAIAWRTRSIIFPLILHAAIGIGTDFFIGYLMH